VVRFGREPALPSKKINLIQKYVKYAVIVVIVYITVHHSSYVPLFTITSK